MSLCIIYTKISIVTIYIYIHTYIHTRTFIHTCIGYIVYPPPLPLHSRASDPFSPIFHISCIRVCMSVCARRRESFRFLEVNYCSKIIEFLSKIRGAISKAGYRIYIYIYIYTIYVLTRTIATNAWKISNCLGGRFMR